eukprot:scaffold237311_cov18-Tisochrysis_lutea.AAC.1
METSCAEEQGQDRLMNVNLLSKETSCTDEQGYGSRPMNISLLSTETNACQYFINGEQLCRGARAWQTNECQCAINGDQCMSVFHQWRPAAQMSNFPGNHA